MRVRPRPHVRTWRSCASSFVQRPRLVAELHAERTDFFPWFSFPLSSNGVHERSFVSAVRAFRSRRGPFSFEVRAGPRRLRSFEFEVHEIRANVKGYVVYERSMTWPNRMRPINLTHFSGRWRDMRSTRNHRGPRRGGRPSCRRYGSSSSFICSEQDTTVVVSGLRAIISHPIPGGLAAGERERGGRGEARGAHAAGGGRRIRGPGAPITSPNVQQQIRADWGRPRRRHRPRAQLGDGAPSTEKPWPRGQEDQSGVYLRL